MFDFEPELNYYNMFYSESMLGKVNEKLVQFAYNFIKSFSFALSISSTFLM